MVRPSRLGERLRLSQKSSPIAPSAPAPKLDGSRAARGLLLDQDDQGHAQHPVVLHGICHLLLRMAPLTTSLSATSMSPATRVGSCGSTKVRMFGDAHGARTSSRLGEASQWSLSLTLWVSDNGGHGL